MIWPNPFCIRGSHVTLVPLAREHAQDLSESVCDGDLHKLWYTSVPAPQDVPAEIDRRLALQDTGSMLPFAILATKTGHAVGMTTFMNIDAEHRRVEIGSTWYRKAVQRSAFNTECKLLLLRHAFENLDCIAVEFRTHVLNRQSRAAIERLGAKLDGVLRAHKIMDDGSLRDTAVYSITASEWPAVRTNLYWKLENHAD